MSEFTGKGSKQRPFDKDKFDASFAKIFSNKKKDKEECKKETLKKS